MAIYPLTASQLAAATTAQSLAFLKSPTLLARRMSEILAAQEFIGYSLLTGRYRVEGGAIAVPKNEVIRADRPAETVNPGSEYKLTPISSEDYDLYQASKDGLATEVTDEAIGRNKNQPIEEALQVLKVELLIRANTAALAAIASKVTATIAAGAAWTTGKQIVKDVLRAKAQVRALKLGFDLNTVILTEAQYAAAMPEVFDMLPDNDPSVISGSFPNVLGLTWLATADANFSNPLLLDRNRLGGIAREDIPSPEYARVPAINGVDTGVEIASIRQPNADKTRVQARNAHVPVVVNPAAGVFVTGSGL